MRAFLTLVLLLRMGSVAAGAQAAPETKRDGASQGMAQVPSASAGNLSVEETLKAAQQKLEHGQPQEAIAMLEKLAASGAAKGVQHELGIAYYRTGKLISAEQAFGRAIEEDSNDIESVQMRGLTLYRLGRPAAAIPFLERVRQWTPNANADANYVLGLVLLECESL